MEGRDGVVVGRRRAVRTGGRDGVVTTDFCRATGSLSVDRRGISSVIGTVLMVVLTILLASAFAVGEFDTIDREVDRVRQAGESHAGELVWSVPRVAATTATHRVEYYVPNDSDTVGNSPNSVEIDYSVTVTLNGDVSKAGEIDPE